MRTCWGLGVLVGCSDVTVPVPLERLDPIPATLPASVSLDQLVEVLSRVACARIFQCMPDNSRVSWRVAMGSYARCLLHDDHLPEVASYARLPRLVAMGVLRYDGTVGRRCLDALRTQLCDPGLPSACEGMFVGTVVEGGACRHSEQCLGDTYCDLGTEEGGSQCPGRCRARVPLGARCASGNSSMCSQRGASGPVTCEYDPTLRGEARPYRCSVAPRSEPVSPGGICYDPSVPESRVLPCASGYECRREALSDGAVEPVMRCQAPPVLGQACRGGCGDGSLCEFNPSSGEQRCTGVRLQREGERCVQGNRGGEVCDVLAGFDCVAGRCQRVGTGQEGSVCFSSRFGVDNCARGLYCSAATLTCQRRKPDGAPCRSGEECESRECLAGSGTMPSICGTSLGCR